MTTVRKIKLDVSKTVAPFKLIAKEGDSNSRYINVTILDDGTAVQVPSGAEVILGVHRSDKQANAFKGTVEADGTCTFLLQTWVLSMVGVHSIDVSVLENGTVLLSTFPCNLTVVAAACDEEGFEDNEDYSIVAKYLGMPIDMGSGIGAMKIGTDLQATGDYALAQGYGEIIRDADSSSATYYFNELEKIGVIEEGVREIKVGIASGEHSLSLLNAVVDGLFGVGIGRGNFVRGKAATGIGYENIIDAQDGTGIGQRNFIRGYRAGFILGPNNRMNPDGNADGDTEPSNGFILGANSEIHADSSAFVGLYGNLFHWNTFGLGRRIISAGPGQLLLGFTPYAESNTLCSVGDGDEDGTAPHSWLHIYKDTSTGRATLGYIDVPSLGIGPGNVISHTNVFALGPGHVSAANDQTLAGRYSKANAAHLFVIGNGTAENPGNILEIYKDGKRTYLGTSLGVGEISSLSFSGNMYQGCLIAGRGITATNNWQTIVGSYPKLPQYSLFVVGDGTKGSPSNAMYIASDANGKATFAQVNCRINCDKKISAGGAPEEDNDVIRLIEFNELLDRVKKLEASFGNFTLTFASELANTEFTLSVDGGAPIAGADCVGNSFAGKEFTFTPNSDVEVGIWYITDSNSEEQSLVDDIYLQNESVTLTLTENVTVTQSWYH